MGIRSELRSFDAKFRIYFSVIDKEVKLFLNVGNDRQCEAFEFVGEAILITGICCSLNLLFFLLASCLNIFAAL